MQNSEPSETTYEIIKTAVSKSWINHTALAIYKISHHWAPKFAWSKTCHISIGTGLGGEVWSKP